MPSKVMDGKHHPCDENGDRRCAHKHTDNAHIRNTTDLVEAPENVGRVPGEP